ncbi:phosphotransferase [Streptomyces sp. KL116D]|uniref:phosphotransferase n=1 Tax=Streptomyces sp. KL116D TaxID=3045152 RepID=UPI003556CFDE
MASDREASSGGREAGRSGVPVREPFAVGKLVHGPVTRPTLRSSGAQGGSAAPHVKVHQTCGRPPSEAAEVWLVIALGVSRWLLWAPISMTLIRAAGLRCPNDRGWRYGQGQRDHGAADRETIRRPVGSGTSAVHALLTTQRGGELAPRAPRSRGTDGTDECAVAGAVEPAFHHLGRRLSRSTTGISELVLAARVPRRRPGTSSRRPTRTMAVGQEDDYGGMIIIRHGDLGPWNSIWNGDRLAGFIDWDLRSRPGALDDLAQSKAWYVPCRPSEQQRRASISGEAQHSGPPRRPLRRLRGTTGSRTRRLGCRPVPRGRAHRTTRPSGPRAMGNVPCPRRCVRDGSRAILAPIRTHGSPRGSAG